MGASYYMEISGVKPADQDFKAKYEALQACIKAGVGAPQKLIDFFGIEDDNDEVDPNGVTVPLYSVDLNYGGPKTIPNYIEEFDHSEDGLAVKGAYIDVSKIPEDVKIIKCSIKCSY